MGYVLIFWAMVNGAPVGMATATFQSEEACKTALQNLDLYGPPPFGTVKGLCLSAATGKT